MDTNIALSIAGIAVSIGVGVGTFYLADKRSRTAQWRAAKETVLRELSKSLGDGNIPQPQVILATIRSVLRENGAANLEAVTFEEIIDDLIRQVTSDPFLSADRRKELQSKIIEIRFDREKELAEVQPKDVAIAEVGTQRESFSTSVMMNLVAGVIASLVAGLFFTKLISTDRLLELYQSFRFYRIVTAVIIITLILSILMREKVIHNKLKRRVPDDHTKAR